MTKQAILALRQFHRSTGAVRNAIEQCQYLAALGYQVTLLAEKAAPELLQEARAEWVKVWKWPIKGKWRRLWFNLCVQRWLKKNPVDVFISHGDALSNDILVLHNCLHLHHERVGTPLSDAAFFHERMLRAAGYRLLIANSCMMKQDIVKRFGIDESKIEVFYQGVDLNRFNYQQHDLKRAQGRARLKIEDDLFCIGLVTSGDFKKRNVALFLSIAGQVIQRVKQPLLFVVAGKTADLASFKKQAAALGIGDQILFVEPQDEVDRLYHALDLHLYPALLEEYGRVIPESLACGLPVLASQWVGATELMQDYPLSPLPSHELEIWVDRVVAFCEQDALQRDAVSAGLRIAQHYSQEKQFAAMVALIEQRDHQ
ncbi:glycosyltransferase family 4 protein [Marinospirillum sp.]|uniref:glycosyltransferase family 4 protein n=1 Tax=Marinospirillum sp. TaxID=2183934 RepID=UPI003A886640